MTTAFLFIVLFALLIIGVPIGVWLLQFTSTSLLWWLYVAVLLFLAWRMAFPPTQDDSVPSVVTDGTRWKAAGARVCASGRAKNWAYLS